MCAPTRKLGEVSNDVAEPSEVPKRALTTQMAHWLGSLSEQDHQYVESFSAWGPRLMDGLWMVGDSIFPGQSIPAVALGGMRVAGMILREGMVDERQPSERAARYVPAPGR